VDRQCVSDVPVGSYLSGGIDSGTITALAARRFGRIRTFTGGFDLSEAQGRELRFDERELAEKMASVFQTEHYECVLHSGDMAEVMDDLIWHLEDLRVGQCYPNYYLARLAGRFVKVVLSGTGGDELFGGYPWRYAAAVADTREDYVQNYYRYWKRLVRNRDKPRLFAPEVESRLRELEDDAAVPFCDHTISSFRRVLGEGVSAEDREDQVNYSLYFECKTFLHGLLVVEDKLSMAHSLESRVPLLDNELVDVACRVPVRLKLANLENLYRLDENLPRKKQRYERQYEGGKKILRDAMRRILPEEVAGARKQGFSAPDESWFRGSAEKYVRAQLLGDESRVSDYMSLEYVEDVLDQHSAGSANNRLLIWSLLSLQHWLARFL
jgi:asparagine synthase (glutamine-hydrolysing)